MTIPSRVTSRRRVFLSGGGGEQVPRDPGGDGTVAGDLGGERAVRVEQRLDGHQDLHLDAHVAGGGLSGQPFDEGVGEDLSAAAGDRVGGDVVLVDRPVQRTEAGGGLFGGQVRDEVGHAVGGQPDPYVPSRPRGPGLELAFSGATSMARPRVRSCTRRTPSRSIPSPASR